MKCPHCNNEMVVWYRDDQDSLYMPVRDVPYWFCKHCDKWVCKWSPSDNEYGDDE
jgi:hypothetical protein